MAQIPDNAKRLLEGKHLASVATLMADGSPQVTPVWIGHEDGQIVFNTVEGRLKHTNLERDGRIAVSVFDHDNPYMVLTVRGRVTEITREGADDHINALAKRYLGADEYPYNQPGDVRVIVRIEPEKVGFNG